jgi:T-complex protein 1 subunit delta
LRDIRIVKKVGGTIEDTELVEGVVLNQNVVASAGGPTRVEKAKIGLIQFQLSAPKPDVGVTIPDPSEELTSFADGQHCDN